MTRGIRNILANEGNKDDLIAFMSDVCDGLRLRNLPVDEGVGAYTFSPWKIAICGLYKKLDFRLIGKIGDKPVVFDDTVYFISFDDESVAYATFENLSSSLAKDFYSSLIFWDEKRPIKSSILNNLNLTALVDDSSSILKADY